MPCISQAHRRIAFATYPRRLGLDAGDTPAVEPLQALGIEVEPALWESPSVSWKGYDAVIVRSCWDYHEKLTAFLGWISRLEALCIPLWNPPTLLRWNLDKLYLKDLQVRGVPLLPTVWLERGSAASLFTILVENDWEEAVVKPTIAAGAYHTWRTSRQTARGHQPRLERLLSSGGVMVQQFAEMIIRQGEWSLVFFQNGYSYAVLKRPQIGDFRVQSGHGGTIAAVQPPSSFIAQAERALDEVPNPWLYARFDGCVFGGEFRLMELEMLEPSLFLNQDPEAPGRFAQAIVDVLT